MGSASQLVVSPPSRQLAAGWRRPEGRQRVAPRGAAKREKGRAGEYEDDAWARAGEYEDDAWARAGECEDDTWARAGEHEGHTVPRTRGSRQPSLVPLVHCRRQGPPWWLREV